MRSLAVAREEPTEMGAPELASQRRMKILIGVGNQMMMSMMGRPPKRTFLVSGSPCERDQKLKKPAGAIGAMGQQAVKARGDRKHSHDIERQTGDDRDCAHAGPNDQ